MKNYLKHFKVVSVNHAKRQYLMIATAPKLSGNKQVSRVSDNKGLQIKYN
jgi:hypothetical protein